VFLDDFPISELYETIPDFHNTRRRFRQLKNAIERDSENRAQITRSEIEYIIDKVFEIEAFHEILDLGKISKRVTHNDTKIDNAILDNNTGDGVCH
jgi:hypothetical protein